MVRRSSSSIESSGSAKDLEQSRVRLLKKDHFANLPSSVGQGNLMLANWVVGKEATVDDVGRILAIAPFTCVVMVLTSAVAEKDAIAMWLSELDESRDDESRWSHMHPQVAQIHGEKAVYKITPKVYIAIHKAKVKRVMFVERLKASESSAWSSSASCSTHAAVAEHRGITMGTLTLFMDQTRQRYEEIKIGILDVRKRVNRYGWSDSLVEWIVSDRLAAVTGHFGENWELVGDTAIKAKAVHCQPLAQYIQWQDPQSRHWQTSTLPNYFIFFGYYRTITVPAGPDPMPDTVKFAQDLWDEVVSDFPHWPKNDEGSPFVPNLGAIKMKRVVWPKWINNVFQTVIWLGTATPGKNRRKNKRSKSAGAKAGAKAGAGIKAGTKRNTGIGLAGAKGGDAAVAETLAVAERMPQSRRRYSLIAIFQ